MKQWYPLIRYPLIMVCILVRFGCCILSDHVVTSCDMTKWQCLLPAWLMIVFFVIAAYDVFDLSPDHAIKI